ncbi:MAG: 50S ribosomal protein L24 [Methanonatronarchaeales archaeon]|nr:50S ribosomal protein L24 [Methanonatronarchaeales archaeon]
MSRQPRKQRKNLYEAPLHERQDLVSATLSGKLRDRYGMRRVNVRSGDEVEVMRGDHEGESGRVEEVDLESGLIVVRGVTTEKGDGSTVEHPLHPSNVRVTRLDTSDPRREAKLEED